MKGQTGRPSPCLLGTSGFREESKDVPTTNIINTDPHRRAEDGNKDPRDRVRVTVTFPVCPELQKNQEGLTGQGTTSALGDNSSLGAAMAQSSLRKGSPPWAVHSVLLQQTRPSVWTASPRLVIRIPWSQVLPLAAHYQWSYLANTFLYIFFFTFIDVS